MKAVLCRADWLEKISESVARDEVVTQMVIRLSVDSITNCRKLVWGITLNSYAYQFTLGATVLLWAEWRYFDEWASGWCHSQIWVRPKWMRKEKEVNREEGRRRDRDKWGYGRGKWQRMDRIRAGERRKNEGDWDKQWKAQRKGKCEWQEEMREERARSINRVGWLAGEDESRAVWGGWAQKERHE